MQMDFSAPRAQGGRKRNRIFALHPSYAKAEHYSASGKEGGERQKIASQGQGDHDGVTNLRTRSVSRFGNRIDS